MAQDLGAVVLAAEAAKAVAPVVAAVAGVAVGWVAQWRVARADSVCVRSAGTGWRMYRGSRATKKRAKNAER